MLHGGYDDMDDSHEKNKQTTWVKFVSKEKCSPTGAKLLQHHFRDDRSFVGYSDIKTANVKVVIYILKQWKLQHFLDVMPFKIIWIMYL